MWGKNGAADAHDAHRLRGGTDAADADVHDWAGAW